jgi:hypothetical protein
MSLAEFARFALRSKPRVLRRYLVLSLSEPSRICPLRFAFEAKGFKAPFARFAFRLKPRVLYLHAFEEPLKRLAYDNR